MGSYLKTLRSGMCECLSSGPRTAKLKASLVAELDRPTTHKRRYTDQPAPGKTGARLLFLGLALDISGPFFRQRLKWQT